MSMLLFIAGGAMTGALFGSLAAKHRRTVDARDDTLPTGEGDSGPETGEVEPESTAVPQSRGAAVELPEGVIPPKPLGVPFATGIAQPVWPLRTRHPRRSVVSYRGIDGKVRGKWGRRFRAHREGSDGGRDRNHAGIDLFAEAGDTVQAMAPGIVTAVQSFHLGSWAVFVEHAGVVVMYGEVQPQSWKGLGVSVGSEVAAGQPIAKVACMRMNEEGQCTSHMLHLETYVLGTTENRRWYVGEDAPPALLDPTLLLLRAAQETSTPSVA